MAGILNPEIWKIVALVWTIVKELIKFYKHLEEKYHWGKDKGPDVKREIRDKKRNELDAEIVALIKSRGLPEPDRETQAYIRERVHDRMSKKKRSGKTRGRA